MTVDTPAPKATREESLPAGVWGVVATPFSSGTLDVDSDSLRPLVKHYEAIGAEGLTVLGVFGEAAALSAAERKEALQTVTEATTVQLVVGVTSLSTPSVISEVQAIQAVAGRRLAAVMIQINSTDPEAVTAHLQAVHEATGAKVVLQDYPAASGISVPTDAVIRIVQSCGFIIAVKAESPPTSVAIAELSAHLDVSIFGGLGGQGLLDELMAGSAGAMTGFSYPEGLIACVDAWQQDGYEAARRALLPYLPLINFEQQAKIALSVRKECLRQRGLIAESDVRPPAAAFPESLRDPMMAHLHLAGVSEIF